MIAVPSPDALSTALLLLARTTAFVPLAPVIGHPLVPAQVKIGIAALLALLLWPVTPLVQGAGQWGVAEWTLAILREVGIGAALALIAQMPIAAAHLGGQIVGFQLGLTVANVFDPVTHAQSGLLARLAWMIAVTLWLAIGAHRWLISAWIEAAAHLPLGAPWPLVHAGAIAGLGTTLFALGLRLAAAPVLLILLLQLALGLLSRASPQIQVFFVGFPLTIAIGLLAFALALSAFATTLVTGVHASMQWLGHWLEAIAPSVER